MACIDRAKSSSCACSGRLVLTALLFGLVGDKAVAQETLQLSPSLSLGAADQARAGLVLLVELDKLFDAAQHEAAGTLGLQLLEQGVRPNETQRLNIANSLAWSNRLPQAVNAYQTLLGGRHDAQARLAIANALRWDGHPDLAMPEYQRALVSDLGNRGAVDGLEYSARELRPSTTVSVGGAKDSSDMRRNTLMVNHRWRGANSAQIFELETRVAQDKLDPAQLKVSETDLTIRYQDMDLPLTPKVHLNLMAKPHGNVYGGLRLKLAESTFLSLDRQNWGIASFSARALDQNLSAYRVGMDSRYRAGMGEFAGAVHIYRISDSNTVLSSSFKFTPSWRPLGPGLKFFTSVETRDVRFNTLNYWSPKDGSGTAYLGVLGEWSEKDWSLYGSAQVGRPVYGEAGSAWSVSAAGKRWINTDMALGFNLWSLSSWRDGLKYRAHSMAVNLEKLW
ncbi:MAG: hypothetical protein KA045_01095 [Burkholderiaceae bacterium]|jgi:hypothetical protein|nr:hypothetical protein [Burkholderiaceae bacterium]